MPRYEDRLYAISDELINPALLSEIEAYIGHLEGKDLFAGMARPFRPKSIKAVRGHIRRYLSALHHSGFNVSTLTSLEAMVAFGERGAHDSHSKSCAPQEDVGRRLRRGSV